MVAILGMCAFGLVQALGGSLPMAESAGLDIAPREGWEEPLTTFGLVVLLARAFSSGCAALTGVEAISNGVPAFKRPESKNAATTLTWMAFILGGLFFGVSLLAHRLQPYPSHDQTVFSQMGLRSEEHTSELQSH